MKNKNVVLLFNEISDLPGDDEADVIKQMANITRALKVLGYTPYCIPFSLEINEAIGQLRKIKPYVVFNMVEMVAGTGAMLHFASSILEFLKLPYTGVPNEPLFITTSKILTKKLLIMQGIPTCGWYTMDQVKLLKPGETYIVKPIWEDGSLGIEENCVFSGSDKKFIRELKKYNKKDWFIEKFIDGREINLSILGGKGGPYVMPPAEIQFKDYPEGKPRVVGYKAKWSEGSFEYTHTPRTFRFKPSEKPLLDQIVKIGLHCWHEFGLRGYARVDFRVDGENNPYVLEINGNPSITPESGFVAATKRAGLSFPEVVQRIIEDAVN